MQRMCIAKNCDLYFTEEETRRPCGTGILLMPKFWMWHPSGDLNAMICNNHAAIAVNGKGYLSEQVRLAMRKQAEGQDPL